MVIVDEIHHWDPNRTSTAAGILRAASQTPRAQAQLRQICTAAVLRWAQRQEEEDRGE